MVSFFSDEEWWNADSIAWNQKKASQGERQPSQSQSYSTITITFNNHNHNQQSEEGISGKEALRIRCNGYKVSSFAAGKDFYRRYAKKSMFKIVYHGGLTDPMAGLMAVPEARQVQKRNGVHRTMVRS